MQCRPAIEQYPEIRAKCECKLTLDHLSVALGKRSYNYICLLDCQEIEKCTTIKPCSNSCCGHNKKCPDLYAEKRLRKRKRECIVVEAKLCIKSEKIVNLNKRISEACEQLEYAPGECRKIIVFPRNVKKHIRGLARKRSLKLCDRTQIWFLDHTCSLDDQLFW